VEDKETFGHKNVAILIPPNDEQCQNISHVYFIYFNKPVSEPFRLCTSTLQYEVSQTSHS